MCYALVLDDLETVKLVGARVNVGLIEHGMVCHVILYKHLAILKRKKKKHIR